MDLDRIRGGKELFRKACLKRERTFSQVEGLEKVTVVKEVARMLGELKVMGKNTRHAGRDAEECQELHPLLPFLRSFLRERLPEFQSS
jgi:hypothetical protein